MAQSIREELETADALREQLIAGLREQSATPRAFLTEMDSHLGANGVGERKLTK